MRKQLLAIFLAAFAFLAPMQAKAGIPVIDVTAVANLIQQVMYWQQQISAMQKQFDQLKASKEQLQQTYSSMTGTRGMDQLLPMSNMDRNYLPQSYDDLMRVTNGSSQGYAGLSGQVQSVMDANKVLSTTQMDALSPDMRQMVDKGRQASAMLNGLTRNAYQNTSSRFSALQQLIGAIGRTNDPKAIQELQARIQAEQNMLTNEQTKLQSLYQIAQAEDAAQQQRAREQVISGHGGFSNRFVRALDPMSKTVLIIVIAVIAAAAGGGAYHVLTQQQPTAVSPPGTPPPELPATASPQKPVPDHGSFQKRFQPSMPPAEGK